MRPIINGPRALANPRKATHHRQGHPPPFTAVNHRAYDAQTLHPLTMTSKPLILIVEDEPGIADTLQYALRTEGFEPQWCATGQAALKVTGRT